MRKKLLGIGLALLLALLSGCACEHEWTEADCVNPAVCTKCSETGAEALGHNWAAATCGSPETCLRCGAQQGDALGHSYGDWSFEEDQMTHTCSVCAFEETAEIDRELYLETLLSGYWDFYASVDGEETQLAMDLVFADLSLSFGDDHSVTFTQSSDVLQSTWNFLSCDLEDAYPVYYFSANYGDSLCMMALDVPPDDEKFLYIVASDGVIMFTQNQEAVSSLVGSWGVDQNEWGVKQGNLRNWITFRDDRTVSGNLNGSFDGVWHLVPIIGRYATNYGIVIEYTEDGEVQLLQGKLFMDDLTLQFDVDDTYNYFRAISEDELTNIQVIRSQLLGSWTSLYISENYHCSPQNAENFTSEYSIAFQDDGSFTAILDGGKTYTGTWDMFLVAAEQGTVIHDSSYYLYFDGQRGHAYCQLDTFSGDTYLTISQYPNANGNNLFFVTEEKSEEYQFGSSLIVGDWTSYYISHSDPETGSWENVFTADHSLTFHDDGTFTGLLDKEVAGTWTYAESSTVFEYAPTGEVSENPVWHYKLTFQGESATKSLTVEKIGSCLRFSLDIPDPENEDQQRYIDMRKPYPDTEEQKS